VESKKLIVRLKPNAGSMKEIAYEGGGQVPDILSGAYNRIKAAEEAIALYMAAKSKPKREYRKSKSNGKKESES